MPSPTLAAHSDGRTPTASAAWPTSAAPLLRACLRRASGPLAAAMACSMVRQLAFLAIPYLIGQAIDQGVVGADLAALSYWCAVLTVAVVVEFVGLCGWIWWANASEMRIAADLRETMLDVAIGATHGARTEAFDGVGDFVERVVDDVDTVLHWLHGLATWIVIATTVVVLVPAILAMDPGLLAVTAACAALLLVVSIGFPRADRPRMARLATAQGRRSQQVAELLATALTVRGFGGQHRLLERHHATSAEITRSRLSVARLRALWTSSSQALPQLGVAAGLVIGSWSALYGGLAVGQIATFAMWMGTVERATTAATSRLGEHSAALAAAQRIAAVLRLRRQPSGSTADGRGGPMADPTSPDGLRLAGLLVRRSGWQAGPVHAAVERGHWCLLTGPTGAGKSTLLAAIMGAVPADGTISLDQDDLTALDVEGRAPAITLVPQQPLLLHGSVRDNLLLGAGSRDVPESRLLEVCHAAVFDEVLAQLPDGLDTAVGERGAQLSGGQRARLAIARALLRPGPVLLLDDVSSALDAHTEAQLLARMRAATHRHIVLWASHRPSVADAADLVLDLGRLR
ncbi:MAG: ABC transporter ATP-binding protein [Micropruina sp.]|uniref:ABC transporter ATP-binding protein n=1 Tax=Micropruina sp. TaxID=2737536 RepID=UPI0039E42003